MHEIIYLKRVPSESIGAGSRIRPLSTTSMARSANSGLDGKTNFFEKRVGDYGKMDDTSDEIGFDEEF